MKFLKIKYLYILMVNITKEDLVNPKIEYDVYYPLDWEYLSKLDLSICSNDKCKTVNCSKYIIESILNDSCIYCKVGFYPIFSDNLNEKSFIKYYKDLDGYYLDKNTSSYKKCFFTCETCDNKGNNTNIGKIFCTPNLTCSDNKYNKLILEKIERINNCS